MKYNIKEDFDLDADDEAEKDLKAYQDRICSNKKVLAIAYKGTCVPPYYMPVYLIDEKRKIYAGTITRDDRYPTIKQITDALTKWRGKSSPKFVVSLYKGK
jgi:hypothetical protein